ncbi:MAG: tRNA lysidine(34) synthetase TilS, partial [Chloroflexi bacterium]|nr:tRNA lysidine(34) synthetase TilS [Chloroflexota bacterium]
MRQKPLPHHVLHFIQEHHLFNPGETVLVGVSGGADSLCLFYVLLQLQGTLGIRLHIAHLNHLLRGAESDADADYIANICQWFGVPSTIRHRDVRSYQRQLRCSLEEAAREVRYGFFVELAKTVGANRVAVGHTADDQVETILMHLVRGTGMAGLRGMQPLSSWPSAPFPLTVVRPLLSIKHAETVAYCQEQNLEIRFDSSNLSRTPLR